MPRSVAELLPSIPPAAESQDGLMSSTGFRIVGEQSGAATFDPTAVDLSRSRSYSDVTQSGAMPFALDGAVTPVSHVFASVEVTGDGSAITYTTDFAAVDGSDLTGSPYSGFTGTKRLMLMQDPATSKALVAWTGTTAGGIAVEDEGVEEAAAATRLNFAGAGVSVGVSGPTATITIPGAAAAGSDVDGTVLMPETYGAVGDGVTDDTDELLAMIADIVPGVGVWMRPGAVYAVSASVTISAKDGWIWHGNNSTIKALSTYPVDSSIWGPLRIVDSDNWAMFDQIVDGNRANRAGANGGAAVAQLNVILAKCYDWSMVRVKSYRAASDGFILQNSGTGADAANWSYRGKLIDCEGVDSGRNGMSIIYGTDIEVRGGRYSDNQFAGPCAGIDIEPQSDGALPVCSGIRIIGITAENNSGAGVNILHSTDLRDHYVTDIVVRDCKFRNNGGRLAAAGAANATGAHAPVYINSRGNVSVENCSFENHTLVTSETRGTGVFVATPGGLKRIVGNTFRGNSGIAGSVAGSSQLTVPGQIAVGPTATGAIVLIQGNLVDIREHACPGIMHMGVSGAVYDNMILADGTSGTGIGIWGVDVTQHGNRGFGGAVLYYGPAADLVAGRTRAIYHVAASADDAEQNLGTNSVSITSSDLELTSDGAVAQLVGVRWDGIVVDQGETVPSAYVQFVGAENDGGGTLTLTAKAQAHDDAPAFTTTTNDIGARALTTASTVVVNPAAWLRSATGPESRIDVTAALNEVFARGGWVSGNAVAIIISGTAGNARRAHSWDGTTTFRPRLVIERSE